MNDIGEFSQPIPDNEILAYEARGPSLLEERQALFVKLNRVSLAVNFALAFVCLSLAATIAALLPLKQIIPLFVNINTDGTHETLRDFSEIPASRQEDAVISVLWTFVLNREEYYYVGAPRQYEIVSALSTGTTQSEYQNWFKTDTNSPQYKFKNLGNISVEMVPNSAYLKDRIDTCRKLEWCEATFDYWRTTKMNGQTPSPKKRYTASLTFVFVDSLDAGERTTINPAAIKVIAYHSDCDDCGS